MERQRVLLVRRWTVREKRHTEPWERAPRRRRGVRNPPGVAWWALEGVWARSQEKRERARRKAKEEGQEWPEAYPPRGRQL